MRMLVAMVTFAAAIPAFASEVAAAAPASALGASDSALAWPFALGFLGLVVLRRMRPGPMN